MSNSNRIRHAAYLPDEMEDVQPKRHIPKSVNKEQGRSKELAPKQAGEAHNLTGHETEKKRRSASKPTTRSRRREKLQSTRGLSSDPEQEEESGSSNFGSDEGTEDSEIKIVERPQSTKPAALPRPRVEEHIDVMQEGQANLHERMAQLEKKVEYYKNLSEERLNDVVQWVGGNAPRPPWALQPASGSATKTIKSEDAKPKGGDLKLTEPKRPRKKKGDNPTVKSLDEVDLANDLSTHVRTRLYKWMGVTDSMAVNEPQFNPDGTPKFWVMDGRGVEQLRPHWGSNLGLNLEGPGAWVRDFIASCMDPSKMPAGMGDRFKSLVADDYLKTLNAGKSALKNIKTRRNNRHKKKHEMRQGRRTGTILAAPEWDPAFQLRCTSPELSDAENKSEALVIEEQEWLDPLVCQAHQALDQKAFTQSGVKIKALSRRAVMFEGSIPLTKKDKPIPRWMVSDSYALKHPQFLAAASELIDFTQTNRPNIDELTTVFKATPRTYIPACPRTVGDEALLNLSVADASDVGLPGSRQDTPASAVFEPQPRPSEPPTPVEPSMPVCANNEPLVVPTPRDEPPTSSTSSVPHGNTQSGYVPGSSAFTTPFAPTLPVNPPPQAPHPSSYALGRYGGAYIQSPQTATFGHPSSHGQPMFILHNGQYLQVVQPNQQLSGDNITGASYPTAHHGPMHPDEGLSLPGPSHIAFNPSHQDLPPTPQHSYLVSSLSGPSGESQMRFNGRSQGEIIVDPSLDAGPTQEPHPGSLNETHEDKGKDVYKPPPVYSTDGVRMNTPPILDSNNNLEQTAQAEPMVDNTTPHPAVVTRKRGRPRKTEEQKQAEQEAKRQKQVETVARQKENKGAKEGREFGAIICS